MKKNLIKVLVASTFSLAIAGCENIPFFDHVSLNEDSSLPTATLSPANNPVLTKNSDGSTFKILLASNQSEPSFNYPLRQNNLNMFVSDALVLTRQDLSNVIPIQDSHQKAYVKLLFTPEGGQRLNQMTTNNKGRSLALVMQGQAVSIIKITQSMSQVLFVPMSNPFQATSLSKQIADGD